MLEIWGCSLSTSGAYIQVYKIKKIPQASEIAKRFILLVQDDAECITGKFQKFNYLFFSVNCLINFNIHFFESYN